MVDLEAIQKEIEEAGNYEHDGCITLRLNSATALVAEVKRLRPISETERETYERRIGLLVAEIDNHLQPELERLRAQFAKCPNCGESHPVRVMPALGLTYVECPSMPAETYILSRS